MLNPQRLMIARQSREIALRKLAKFEPIPRSLLPHKWEQAMHRRAIINCFGTAFFLAGLQESDMYLHDVSQETDAMELLEDSRIQIGSLVVGRAASGLCHMGVITDVENFHVAHRRGRNGSFEENVPLEQIKKRYASEVSWEMRNPGL